MRSGLSKGNQVPRTIETLTQLANAHLRDDLRLIVENHYLADATAVIADTLRALDDPRQRQEFIAAIVAVADHYKQKAGA